MYVNFLFQVIPPGMEFHHIIPQDGGGDLDNDVGGNEESSGGPDPPIWSEVYTTLGCLLTTAYIDDKQLFPDFYSDSDLFNVR